MAYPIQQVVIVGMSSAGLLSAVGFGPAPTGAALVQQVLNQVKARRQRERQQRRQPQSSVQMELGYQPSQAQVERMRRYWESGDPILMGEAIA